VVAFRASLNEIIEGRLVKAALALLLFLRMIRSFGFDRIGDPGGEEIVILLVLLLELSYDARKGEGGDDTEAYEYEDKDEDVGMGPWSTALEATATVEEESESTFMEPFSFLRRDRSICCFALTKNLDCPPSETEAVAEDTLIQARRHGSDPCM
jgi:hypothetical protein